MAGMEHKATSNSKNALGSLSKMAGKVAKGGIHIVATGANLASNAASNVAKGGVTGIMSSGQGFRDFILGSNVVDLAVAVVIGMAFTNLVTAFTNDFITPAMGAIFAGTNLTDLFFTINGSQFKYGDFIAAFIVFLLIVLFLYYCVVSPLQKLMVSVYKSKALKRNCPHCLEEICLLATRCKYCAGEISPSEEEIAQMAKIVSQHNLPRIHCSRLTRCSRADVNAEADQQQQEAKDKKELLERFAAARAISNARFLSVQSERLSFVSASDEYHREGDIEAQMIQSNPCGGPQH